MLNQQLDFKMKRRYKASGLAEFKEEREKKKAIEEVKNETPNELAKSTETIEERPPQTPPPDYRWQIKELAKLLTGMENVEQQMMLKTQRYMDANMVCGKTVDEYKSVITQAKELYDEVKLYKFTATISDASQRAMAKIFASHYEKLEAYRKELTYEQRNIIDDYIQCDKDSHKAFLKEQDARIEQLGKKMAKMFNCAPGIWCSQRTFYWLFGTWMAFAIYTVMTIILFCTGNLFLRTM